MTPADLHAFMAAQRYGVVSSLGPRGAPQSALVGIAVTPDREIVFDTVKSSRKYPNLIARPACSFVLGWSGEQTVQFEGPAARPQGDELRRAQESCFSVWPDGRDRVSWPGITWFLVRPTWIRFPDFDQGPPLIAEFIVRDGALIPGPWSPTIEPRSLSAQRVRLDSPEPVRSGERVEPNPSCQDPHLFTKVMTYQNKSLTPL